MIQMKKSSGSNQVIRKGKHSRGKKKQNRTKHIHYDTTSLITEHQTKAQQCCGDDAELDGD